VTGTLLKPLTRPTLRGSARREGEWIVFTCVGVDSTGLDAASRVGVDLARVQTPDQAVAFVQRYGPLRSWPDSLSRWFPETIRATITLGRAVEIREPLQDVLQAAQQLKDFAYAAIDAKKASKGDLAARERITRHATASCGWGSPAITGSCEAWVSLGLARELSDHLRGARTHVESVAPGQFQLRLLSDTLLGFCWANIAQVFAAKEPLGICTECARVFVVEDGRQKFCEPKCATRARFRRFKERHPAQAVASSARPRRRPRRVLKGRKTR
jgi:hypothetical protein